MRSWSWLCPAMEPSIPSINLTFAPRSIAGRTMCSLSSSKSRHQAAISYLYIHVYPIYIYISIAAIACNWRMAVISRPTTIRSLIRIAVPCASVQANDISHIQLEFICIYVYVVIKIIFILQNRSISKSFYWIFELEYNSANRSNWIALMI